MDQKNQDVQVLQGLYFKNLSLLYFMNMIEFCTGEITYMYVDMKKQTYTNLHCGCQVLPQLCGADGR